MTNIVPLRSSSHSEHKIRPGINIARIASQHFLPVVVHEFVQAGGELPIVFVQGSEQGQFLAVMMLGLEAGENLFVQDDKWIGPYLPHIVQCDPFRLMPTEPGGEKLAVVMDEDSVLVNQTEGEAIFGADGELTEYMTKRREMLTNYWEQDQITKAFIALLTEYGLLGTRGLSMTVDGEKKNIQGVCLIDEEKLAELSDEQILVLQKRGFMRAVHAHLMSLNKLRFLGQIKANRASAATTAGAV